MIEKKLTPKQQAFADYYIELGNAEQAAIKAGYSQKYARGNAHKLVANSCIKAYMDERMEALKTERVADQQEILETLTAVIRGEARSAALIGVGGGEERIEKNMPPTMAERIRAAELLGKRYRMWTDKLDIEHSGEVASKVDLSGLSEKELRALANSIENKS